MKFKISSLILLLQILVVNASDKLLSLRLHSQSEPKKKVSFKNPPFEELLVEFDKPVSIAFKDVRAAAGAPSEDKPDTVIFGKSSSKESIEEIRIKAQTDPFYRALLVGLQGGSTARLLTVSPSQITMERCFSDSEPESTDSEGE